MTPALLRLCADMLLTDQEVVTNFGLPVLTEAEVAILNDAITAHTEAGNEHHVWSSKSEVSTWVLIGACAVLLKGWAAERDRPSIVASTPVSSTLKPGDRVRVARRVTHDHEGRWCHWYQEMDRLVGKVGVVTEVDYDCPATPIGVDVDRGFYFSPEALDLVLAT